MGQDRQAAAHEADNAAVERFLAGDRSAFDELFRRYEDYVYRIAYGIVGDPEVAADVTQDVFVQVYRSLRFFRKGSRFSTWLYRIAANRAVDAARSMKRRSRAHTEENLEQRADPNGDPAAGDDQLDLQERVMAVMDRLPPQHREALTLRYMQLLSIEEMAAVMGCSVVAAKVRLHRARLKFRDLYYRLFPEERRDAS